METNLPTPMTARVYVNLPEGKTDAVSLEFSMVDSMVHGGVLMGKP
jgi:hypothetical protein